MATVSMFLPNLSGTTGLTLFLRKSSDYSLINVGGDALTESAASGWFTATVAEAWTETLSATVIDGDGLVPFGGWLGVGSLTVSDVAVAPGATTQDALMISTTVASVTSPTVLILTAGSPDNDAYKIGQIVVFTDQVTAVQKARCTVSSYIGSSRTLTLSSAPVFTVVAGDAVAIIAVGSTLSESASAVVVIESEDVTIASFPATLNIGDSYDEDNALRLYLRDVNNDPVTAAIGHNFTDGDFAPTVIIAPGFGDRGRVVATVTYVVPGGAAENYLKVEIPVSQSRRAVEGVSTVQCALVWGNTVRKTLITTTVEWIPRL